MKQLTLKAARVNANLTQEKAAEMLGISPQSLSTYENYRHNMDIEVALKLAKIYNQDVNNIKFYN